MGKKLSHIWDVVAGGGGPGAPPYDDRPIKQDIANLKQKDTQLEQRLTQTEQKDNQLEQKINQVEQTHNVDKNNLELRMDNISKTDNNFQVAQSGQTPTQNNHLATKKYVDDKVAQGGGGGGQPFDPTPLEQEDARLQDEINKTNAKVTTVEQTANNAMQKATDNEQGITDLENQARNYAKVNTNNTFTGLQTFELAKVARTPGDVDDVVNWGLAQTKLSEKAFITKANTFNGVQTFNNGIISSFTATGNNDVPNLGTVKNAVKWPFNQNGTFNYGWKEIKGKKVKQFYYQGAVQFRNGKATFKGGVDLAINPNIYIQLPTGWIRFPFYDIDGLMGKFYITTNNEFVLEVPGLNGGQNVKGFVEFTEI